MVSISTRRAARQQLGIKAPSTEHDQHQAGLLTRPVRITRNTTGYPDYEIAVQVRARILGMPRDALKTLVKTLERRRGELTALTEYQRQGQLNELLAELLGITVDELINDNTA